MVQKRRLGVLLAAAIWSSPRLKLTGHVFCPAVKPLLRAWCVDNMGGVCLKSILGGQSRDELQEKAVREI
jgi:hypothetical protein